MPGEFGTRQIAFMVVGGMAGRELSGDKTAGMVAGATIGYLVSPAPS